MKHKKSKKSKKSRRSDDEDEQGEIEPTVVDNQSEPEECPPTESPPVKKRKHQHIAHEVDVSKLPGVLIRGLNRVTHKAESNLTFEDLENADGVWIFKCHRSIPLNTVLAGKKMSLANPTNFSTDDAAGSSEQSIETFPIPSELEETSTILVPDSVGNPKLVSLPVHGRVIIRKTLEETEAPSVSIPIKKPLTIPSGVVKQRHPIYGVDFSHVWDTTTVRAKTESKKSKKSKHKNQELYNYNGNESFVAFNKNIDFHSVNGTKSPVVECDLESDSISSTKSKKKKKKKNKKDADVEDTVVVNGSHHDANEETLLDSDDTIVFPHNDLNSSSNILSSPEKSHKKSKKQKKRKIKEEFEEVVRQIDVPEVIDIQSPKKKKSKKRKHEEIEIEPLEVDEKPTKKLKKIKSEF